LNFNKTKQNKIFPIFFVEKRKKLPETNSQKNLVKEKTIFFSPKHQWLQYIIVMHQTPKLLSYLRVVGKV
jgi:hypothetical protein